jgi:hypothetical protein
MYKKITYHIVEEHFLGEEAGQEKISAELCSNVANTTNTSSTAGSEVPATGIFKS